MLFVWWKNGKDEKDVAIGMGKEKVDELFLG
jgi:hypothetical protein